MPRRRPMKQKKLSSEVQPTDIPIGDEVTDRDRSMMAAGASLVLSLAASLDAPAGFVKSLLVLSATATCGEQEDPAAMTRWTRGSILGHLLAKGVIEALGDSKRIVRAKPGDVERLGKVVGLDGKPFSRN